MEATEAHRQFLQALLAVGAAEGAQVGRLHRQACQRHRVHYAHDRLDDFVRVVNGQLRPLSMEIRKGLSEESGRTFYALVNLAETEITKMASDYSENELELFKKIVSVAPCNIWLPLEAGPMMMMMMMMRWLWMDLVVLSGNGFASSTEILNMADQLKPKRMKKAEAEQLLQTLVQDKWLCEREGEYTLHVRAILELEQYILCHYPEDARKCHLCHSLSIQSQVCEDCGVALHMPCLAKYFQTQTERRCPNCKQFWPVPVPEVGIAGTHLPSSTPKESRRGPLAVSRRR